MNGFTLAGNVSVLSDRGVRSLDELHLPVEVVGNFEPHLLLAFLDVHEDDEFLDCDINCVMTVLQLFSVHREMDAWFHRSDSLEKIVISIAQVKRLQILRVLH